jgi:uncharacterized membrane protein YeiH
LLPVWRCSIGIPGFIVSGARFWCLMRPVWRFFAVAGTLKSFAFNISPLQAPLLGMLTGIGGGMVRDLLVNEIPTVLRSELYAIAALAGALIVVGGHLVQFYPTAATIGGAMLCFTIRMIAIRRGWRLPTAREHSDEV